MTGGEKDEEKKVAHSSLNNEACILDDFLSCGGKSPFNTLIYYFWTPALFQPWECRIDLIYCSRRIIDNDVLTNRMRWEIIWSSAFGGIWLRRAILQRLNDLYTVLMEKRCPLIVILKDSQIAEQWPVADYIIFIK